MTASAADPSGPPFDRVYLDASVLGALAQAGAVGSVARSVSNPRTSYAVRESLAGGLAAGYDHLASALRHLYDPVGAISVADPGDDTAGEGSPRGTAGEGPPEPGERIEVAGSLVRQRKPELLDRLAPDEATVLYQAWAAGAPLATDDHDVRAVADSYDVPVTGSLGLVGRTVADGTVDAATADGWLETWRAGGLAVPTTSIRALLESE